MKPKEGISYIGYDGDWEESKLVISLEETYKIEPITEVAERLE